MNGFSIGLSALAAGRRGLDLVGQNIANASTRGYTRKTLNLTSQTVDGLNGTGVGVASYTRYTAPALRSALRQGDSGQASVSARLEIRRQVESAIPSGAGGIADRADAFANLVGQLTTKPSDLTARRLAISAAADLAGQFRSSAGDLDRLRASVGDQVSATVREVNDYSKTIADLNRRIAVIESGGGQALELRDQRDRAIDDLSGRIDIRTVDQPYGVVNVIASGAAVVVGEFANSFETRSGPGGRIDVVEAGSDRPLGFAAGTLGGLLREYNIDLPETRRQLDDLANGIARQWDQIQATGLGLGGPGTSARGGRGVADPDAPLAGQAPIAVGEWVITLTDIATGARTNVTVPVDPTTQSLRSLAAEISSRTNGRLTAAVNAETHSLDLAAVAGTAFDFAGRATESSGTAVADPDPSGVLSALGLRSLFAGTGAAGMAVRPELLADPSGFAASRTGEPGDGSNLLRFEAARDVRAFAGGTQTFTDAMTALAGEVGATITGLDDARAATDAVLQDLFGQEQSVSGVDVNEEVVRMMDFQRMIQSASKYIATVNESLDAVLSILR